VNCKTAHGYIFDSPVPAEHEAKQLLKLLGHGETIETLRMLIGAETPYRKQVLRHFDDPVRRQPAPAAAPQPPAPEPERLLRCKYSSKQVAQVEQLLRRGEKWRDVAAKTGCGMGTLHRRVGYRKHRTFTAEQLAWATAKLRAGDSWEQTARGLGCCESTLRTHIKCKRPPKPPLPEEHGSRRQYNRGCRCEPCKDANAAYSYAYKHTNREGSSDVQRNQPSQLAAAIG
jgi:hypothetical protein